MSIFRDQCALLELKQDELDKNIVIVPEHHFWQARDMSDLHWPGNMGSVLQHRFDQQEIPCKVLDNGLEYRSAEFSEITSILAFISHPVATNIASSLLVTWIKNFLRPPNWRLREHSRFAVAIECPDGSTRRLEGDNYNANEAEQLIRAFLKDNQ